MPLFQVPMLALGRISTGNMRSPAVRLYLPVHCHEQRLCAAFLPYSLWSCSIDFFTFFVGVREFASTC